MSHDYLGTFNRSQFERFLAFARSQVDLVETRLAHLEREKERVGVLVFRFGEDSVPVAVSASPSNSYLGKLLAAYEILGGNPFLDLRVRAISQALFVVQGTEAVPAAYMSNGEPLSGKGLRDAFSAELIRKIRAPLQGTLNRMENLERKIRRALDYGDQLEKEILQFKILASAATVEGSLENVATQIENLFGDQNYRAIFDDAGSDPIGKNVYAPFSQYDVEPSEDPAVGGPNRSVDLPQRQSTGFVSPGGTGRNTT